MFASVAVPADTKIKSKKARDYFLLLIAMRVCVSRLLNLTFESLFSMACAFFRGPEHSRTANLPSEQEQWQCEGR